MSVPSTVNGYPVLAAMCIDKDLTVVLCHRAGHAAHEYVTWGIYPPTGEATGGHYHVTMAQARVDFLERIGARA